LWNKVEQTFGGGVLLATCIPETMVEMNPSGRRTAQILIGSNLAMAIVARPDSSSNISRPRAGDRRFSPKGRRGRARAEL